MKRSILLSGSLIMLAVGAACHAQRIDMGQSRTAALTPEHTDAAHRTAGTDKKAMRVPVMTRAIAQHDADGKTVVRCDVDHVALPGSHHSGDANEMTRKMK